MTRKNISIACAPVLLVLLCAIGCGTGSQNTTAASISGSRAGGGSVKVTIHWPESSSAASRELHAGHSRLIPVAAQSIRLTIKDSVATVKDALVSRPTAGNTSTITILDIPSGAYTELAAAYPTSDASGTPQAQGSQAITVAAGKILVTPDLTMNTTITSLTVTPSATTATAGGATVSLTATAKDASGNVVLTAPGNVTFSGDKATLGTVSSNSNPATLTPLAAGTINITATEIESKVASAVVAIMISAANGTGGTGGTGGGGTSTDKSKIFVADTGNNRLIGLDAIPTTAFTPFALNAGSVALDAQGRIYFTSGVQIYRMDDITGKNLVIYKNTGGNTYWITLDKQGHIYFYSDLYTLNRMDDMTGTNHVTYDPTNEFGSHLLNGTSGIAIDSQNRIYVTQSLAGRVMRFDDMSGANTITFGTRGSGVNQFQSAAQIAIDSSSRIYVADAGNHRVVRFDDMNGTNWTTFAIPSAAGGANVEGVAVDSGTNPNIYFTDAINGVVYRMNDMSGNGLVQYGAKGAGTGQFNFPDSLAAK